MIALGLILLIVGYLVHISILWTIGIIVLIIGLVFLVLGQMGRAVGGRKYWYCQLEQVKKPHRLDLESLPRVHELRGRTGGAGPKQY